MWSVKIVHDVWNTSVNFEAQVYVTRECEVFQNESDMWSTTQLSSMKHKHLGTGFLNFILGFFLIFVLFNYFV